MTLKCAGALVNAYRDGSERVVDHVQQCLRAIKDKNDELVAMREVYEEAALKRAEDLDKQQEKAEQMPLFGVAVAIKDSMGEAGKPNRAGRPDSCQDVAARDAVVVKRLVDAGAIVIGRANMDELAYGVSGSNPHTGQVRNPLNSKYHPGGSSAGSGAAVGAGMVPIALGTDTAGSVRIPASFCGIVGMRPTHGLVNNEGVAPLCPSFDTVGPMARCVADVARVLSVICADKSLMQPQANLRQLRVTALEGAFAVPLDAGVKGLFDKACRDIQSLVAKVKTQTLEVLSMGPRASGPIIGSQASYAWAKQFEANPESFGEEVAGHLSKGATIKATRYLRALEDCAAVVKGIDALFDEADVLISPATAIVATTVDNPGSQLPILALAVPFSLGGYPAISVPMGQVDGLAVGLQIIAKRGQDALVLALAQAFEKLHS